MPYDSHCQISATLRIFEDAPVSINKRHVFPAYAEPPSYEGLERLIRDEEKYIDFTVDHYNEYNLSISPVTTVNVSGTLIVLPGSLGKQPRLIIKTNRCSPFVLLLLSPSHLETRD